MITTEQLVREMLLSGRHISKVDMREASVINSDCLPQRIKDIRYKTDWDIKYRSVPGKGSLREYWLEPQEIARIREKTQRIERFSEEKKSDEQLLIPQENIAETSRKQAETEKYEQMGLGLLGTSNY